MTIADKIKRCAADPAVQERRRNLRTLYYLYKNNPKTMTNYVFHRVFAGDGEKENWEIYLTQTEPISWRKTYQKVIGTVLIKSDPLMMSDFQSTL